MSNKNKWFFTFGSAQIGVTTGLEKRWVVISGTHDEARQVMIKCCGYLWQRQSKIANLEKSIKVWGLTDEISLEELQAAIKQETGSE